MALRLREDDDSNDEMHEINVTPFIDVVLVLLIIFMVAAPLTTVDIRVDLPALTSSPQPRSDKSIYLSVKADKQLFIGNQSVSKDNLLALLERESAGNKEATLFFQADKSVDYQTLITVMDRLRQAGYLKIGLMGLETSVSQSNSH